MFCPVCQSEPVFPVQLKCSHILCYLCLKGVMNSTQKCPLCIRSIASNVLKRPKFVTNDNNSDRPDFRGMQWFYEGRPNSGYWAYDQINSQFLEQMFSSDRKNCEITISGVLYCVDFVKQIQYQKDCPSKKRKVKRDLVSNISVFKGIAGVSRHVIHDMLSQSSTNTSQSETSGQQLSITGAINDSAQSNDSQDQTRKRIKVEVKQEHDSNS